MAKSIKGDAGNLNNKPWSEAEKIDTLLYMLDTLSPAIKWGRLQNPPHDRGQVAMQLMYSREKKRFRAKHGHDAGSENDADTEGKVLGSSNTSVKAKGRRAAATKTVSEYSNSGVRGTILVRRPGSDNEPTGDTTEEEKPADAFKVEVKVRGNTERADSVAVSEATTKATKDTKSAKMSPAKKKAGAAAEDGAELPVKKTPGRKRKVPAEEANAEPGTGGASPKKARV